MNVIPFPKRGIYAPKPPPTTRQVILVTAKFWIALWIIPLLMAVEAFDEMDRRD
jgi:hypothetical protein